MIYVTIDTCSWLNLISANEYNPQISHLVYWAEHNAIKLLVPETTKVEWNEHKEKIKRNLLDQWNTKKKHFDEYATRVNSSESIIDHTFDLNYIEEQISAIEKLIYNSAYQIKISDAVKILASDKSIKPYKAPFHIKRDSMKDAYIYFSSLEYCKKNSIDKLFFLSDNSDEFGKPLPKANGKDAKGSKTELHPDLKIDYADIEIEYYGEIGRAIHELKKILPLPPIDLPKELNISNNSYFAVEDSEIPIVELLYHLFQKIFAELNYIPIHILKSLFPFKFEQSAYIHYSKFTLTTDNTKLFDFFENIRGNDVSKLDLVKLKKIKGVSNYQKKVKYIYSKLTNNLIFNLREDKSINQTSIYYHQPERCDCVRCCFFRFQFKKSFDNLNKKGNTLKEKLKIAYIHYQIGDYLHARDIYLEVSEEARNSSPIIYFVAQFNLVKILQFIRSRYFKVKEREAIISSLKKIDLSKIARTLNNQQSNSLYEWINNRDFFVSASDEINDRVNKIIDHYYAQINGSWQSNDHLTILINEFAKLDSFLNLNFIIYDGFNEFQILFQRVIEGLFASHSISEKQGTRLNYFDDYWIFKIIYYGKSDEILKYLNRYNLSELKYSKTSDEKDSFFKLIENLLNDPIATKLSFDKNGEKDNYDFQTKFSKYFDNAFTLASIITISTNTLNRIVELLIDFIPKEKLISFNGYKSIKLLIERKGKDIQTKFLISLFKLTVSQLKLHDEDFFESLLGEFKSKKRLPISDTDFNIIARRTEVVCDVCKKIHSKEELVYLYEGVSKKYKKLIKQNLESIVIDKFDADLFYLATLLDVLPLNSTLLHKYFEFCRENLKHKQVQADFLGKNNYHKLQIDKLINLVFKFDLQIESTLLQEIKSYNLYYEWLLDMDNFNYENFDAEWVTEYGTIYYFKTMRKSEKLKKELFKRIKIKSHSKIEKVLLRITYLEPKD